MFVRSRESLELEKYWRAIRSEELVPDSEKFDVLGVPQLVPTLFIATLVDCEEMVIRIRLAGSDLVERIGFEVTGSNFIDSYEEPVQDLAYGIALALHSTPCGLVQINEFHYKHALSDRSELTVLPLVNKQTGARELVGCHQRLGFVDQQDMGRMMFVRPAEEHQWIDIGAGTPGEEEFARPEPR